MLCQRNAQVTLITAIKSCNNHIFYGLPIRETVVKRKSNIGYPMRLSHMTVFF